MGRMREEPALDLDALLAEADWLRPLARKLAGGRDADADDLVQDSLQTAITGGGPKEGVPLRPWLRRVMLNLHAFRQRTEMRRHRRELLHTDDRASDLPDEVVMRAEFRQAVAAAVLRVREPYRRALLLRFFEGRSIARIARTEGVTAATVRSRVHRGLKLLRADLGQSWGEDWRPLCLAIGSTRGWAVPGATLTVAAGLFLAALGYVLLPEEATTQPDPLQGVATPGRAESPDVGESRLATDTSALMRTRTELGTPQDARDQNQVNLRATHAMTQEPVPNARVTLIHDRWQAGGPGDLGSWRMASWHDLAQEYEVLASTDHQGRCRIAPLRNARTAWLVADGLSGYSREVPRLPLDWEPPLPNPVIEVTMWPDLHLRVEVVDEAGVPVPDVPVALGLRGQGSGSAPRSWEGRPRAFGFSDESGVALLRVFGADVFEALEELHQAERIPQWEVWHAMPSVDAERFTVEGLSLESELQRARVVLRHRGAIQVAVDDCPAGARAFLEEHSDGTQPNSGLSGPLGTAVEGVRTSDGFRFHGLPLGREWRLTIAWPPYSNQLTSQWSELIEGPAESEKETQVAVSLSSSTWLSGHFAPPAGGFRAPTSADLSIVLNENQLLGNQHRIAVAEGSTFKFCLKGVLESESERINQAVELDPDMQVCLRFEPTAAAYEGSKRPPLAPVAETRLPLRKFLEGGDLGELAWGSARLVLDGRILDHAGNPVRGVWIRVSELLDRVPGRPNRWDSHGACLSGPEGRFALPRRRDVRATSGHLRVTVSRDTDPETPQGVTIPLLSQELSAVSGPVDLLLPPTGALKVRYRNTVDSTVRARLTLKAEQRQIDIDLPGGRDSLEEDLTRPVPGIPTGTYQMILALNHGWTPVQRTELGTIRVGERPTETPLINVQEALESTRLTLRSRGGNLSLHEAGLRSFPLRRASSASSSRTQQVVKIGSSFHLFHQPLHELRIRGEEQGGWLLVPGYTPHRISNPWTDQTIDLTPAPKITLHVPHPPEVPEGGYWAIILDWQDKPDGIRVNSIRAWFGKDQIFEAQLPAPGRYTLRWQVLNSQREVVREAVTDWVLESASEDLAIELTTPSELASDGSQVRD